MSKISNQYAAMPSLHFAWSTWCACVLVPGIKPLWGKIVMASYPLLTLFAIVVTANHYWIDAAGGAAVLGLGYLIGGRLLTNTVERRTTTRRTQTRRRRFAAMDINALFSVAGKTAVVTGGSRGIGRMIAEGFVSAGADVYITARKAEACDQTAAELNEIGPGKCVSLPFNVAGEEGATAFAAMIAERTPKVDILVNNAGATWGAPIEDFPDEAWDKVLDINVKGLFQLTVEAAPPAARLGDGRGSGARHQHRIGRRHQRARHAELRVRREQGGGAPPHAADGAQPHARPHHRQRHRARPVPVEDDGVHPRRRRRRRGGGEGRPARPHRHPEDVAGLAIFLSSRAGAYLTGAVIACDGGISTKSG